MHSANVEFNNLPLVRSIDRSESIFCASFFEFTRLLFAVAHIYAKIFCAWCFFSRFCSHRWELDGCTLDLADRYIAIIDGWCFVSNVQQHKNSIINSKEHHLKCDDFAREHNVWYILLFYCECFSSPSLLLLLLLLLSRPLNSWYTFAVYLLGFMCIPEPPKRVKLAVAVAKSTKRKKMQHSWACFLYELHWLYMARIHTRSSRKSIRSMLSSA